MKLTLIVLGLLSGSCSLSLKSWLPPNPWTVVAYCVEEESKHPKHSPAYYHKLRTAHGIIASLAWVFFFPLGAILLPFLRSPYACWIHAAVQTSSIALLTGSVATGIIISQKYKVVSLRNCGNYHEPFLSWYDWLTLHHHSLTTTTLSLVSFCLHWSLFKLLVAWFITSCIKSIIVEQLLVMCTFGLDASWSR